MKNKNLLRLLLVIISVLMTGLTSLTWASDPHFSYVTNGSTTDISHALVAPANDSYDEYCIYLWVEKNTYFQFNTQKNNGGTPGIYRPDASNDRNINSSTGAGTGTYDGSKSWKYTGNTGLTKINAAQSSSREWGPYVWIDSENLETAILQGTKIMFYFGSSYSSTWLYLKTHSGNPNAANQQYYVLDDVTKSGTTTHYTVAYAAAGDYYISNSSSWGGHQFNSTKAASAGALLSLGDTDIKYDGVLPTFSSATYDHATGIAVSTISATASNSVVGHSQEIKYYYTTSSTPGSASFTAFDPSDISDLSAGTYYLYALGWDGHILVRSNVATLTVTDVPRISLSVEDGSSNVISSALSGQTITLITTPEYCGVSPTISYRYSTSSSFDSYTEITSTTSTSTTWTVPASTSDVTYYLRAYVTSSGYECNTENSTLTTYGKKTIHVRNNNNWASFKIHHWGTNDPNPTSWGSLPSCTSEGGQWYSAAIYSCYDGFVLTNGGSNDQDKTIDLAYGSGSPTPADGGYYTMSTNPSTKQTLSTSSAPTAPTSVTTTATPTLITNAKMTLNGNIGGNGNDTITDYGFYYGTTSACVNKAQVGTSNTTGAISKQITGLTAGTTYYFKTYATNGQGTSYGDVKSYKLPYKVTVSTNTGCSSITNLGTNYTNSTISVTATKSTGYTFSSWSTTNGTQTSTSSEGNTNTLVFTPTSDNATIQPVYTEDMHDVTVNAQTGGTVSYNGGAAGSSCTARAGIATASANIVATASTGYYFVGWQLSDGTIDTVTVGAYDGVTQTITITATADSKTVTALFNVRYALLGSQDAAEDPKGGMPGWGKDNEAPFTYSEGTYTKTVDLTVPNSTYKFRIVDRRGASHTSYGLSSKAVIPADGNYHDLASTAADAQLTTKGVGTYTLYVQTDGSTSKPKVKIVDQESYSVTFDKGTGGATITASGSETGSITSGQYVAAGEDVTFTQTANTGYTFTGWYDAASGGSVVSGISDDVLEDIDDNVTVWSRYSENMTTVNLVASPASKGTFTKDEVAVTTVYAGITTHPTVTAVPGTGYKLTGTIWSESSDYISISTATGTSTTITATGTTGNSADLTATFTPITYTIKFDGNGSTSGEMSDQEDVEYDAATTITANAFVKTGYTFAGWATSADGSVVRADGAAHGNLTSTDEDIVTLYAKWTAKTSALTLNMQTSETGYESGGTATASASATYDAAMPALTGTLPTAANGYAFMGFYDATGGGGTKYYNADGSSAHVWDKDKTTGTTLYAYYKKAEITALTLDAAVVQINGTVGVTPTVSPTPVGTTTLCFYVFYSNDNPLSPQPEITWNGTKATFSAGETSGTFKIGVSLRTGSSCGGGTLLDSTTVDYQVAGSHTVTVRYKCGDDVIKAETTLDGIRPLDWSDAITAPDIFGYTFKRWHAGDGVTLTADNGVTTNTDTTVATIKIKAIYDGSLTATYTQDTIIYFKNTLGWSDVYVNFYDASYWTTNKGSGNKDKANRNKHMTQIGETDVWYYDYGYNGGGSSISPSLYVSFTSTSQSNEENFWLSGTGVNVVYPANYPDAISTDKSSENGFKAATPMFVPLAAQSAVVQNEINGGKANYYNAGYWTKYTPGTGYTLEIYNSDGSSLLKSVEFTSADELMPMKAVVDLEASTTYQYQVRRGGTSSAGIYYGNSSTMTYNDHGQGTAWEMINTMAGGFTKAGITANAAGEYTFNLGYSANASTQYRLRMAVDYPIKDGDYRVIYKDNVHTAFKPSAIVPKVNNGKDTVSFFIRPGQTPVMKIQQATVDGETGAITWSSPGWDVSGNVDDKGSKPLPQDSVYNICLTMNEYGVISVENVEAYTGNFYIRTDCANSKWDNYRTDPDHLMTYSEYSYTHSNFSHYWMAHVENGTNVKFVVANDYSPCISDTLVQMSSDVSPNHVDATGDIQAEANIRFMWNRHNNDVVRAYLAAAQADGSKFLVLRANSSTDMTDTDGNALLYSANSGEDGYNHKAPDNSIQFVDNENWIYETNVKVKPGAYVKLYANFHGGDVYFKGVDNNTFDASNAIQLITGSGDAQVVRVIYDFKTDRLIAALLPSGETTEAKAINADVMFIREHQGDIAQLFFSGDGEITKINSAYGVMRFNKWKLANKDKSTHDPLDNPKSIYERSLYWISFPFRVKLGEVFGFGIYGTHWAIQRYDGAERAAKGHFLENGSFWRWMDRNTEYLEPNQGYLLAIDLDLLGESSDVWGPGSVSERIELFFPSYGAMPDITSADVTQTIEAHDCTINRAATEGLPDTGDPRTSYNRTIFDSHWNVMSVPTYVNTNDVSFANTTWTSAHPSFLYTWNADDNTITATSASGYEYHAMHAYMVQYSGGITWSASSGSPYPASIVARKTYEEAPSQIEFRLELQQNEQMLDRTYVVLSNDEETSANFAFGEDMVKEFNKNKAAIFNYTADHVGVAGNTMPMSEQTTVIPVGLDIQRAGEYTFAIPEGTDGVGVTLVDNVLNTRTSLSALSYTVNLTAGTHDGRFVLEISPVHGSTTRIEQSAVSDQPSARKMIIDQKLFIIKGDKMYDARGARVE